MWTFDEVNPLAASDDGPHLAALSCCAGGGGGEGGGGDGGGGDGDGDGGGGEGGGGLAKWRFPRVMEPWLRNGKKNESAADGGGGGGGAFLAASAVWEWTRSSASTIGSAALVARRFAWPAHAALADVAAMWRVGCLAAERMDVEMDGGKSAAPKTLCALREEGQEEWVILQTGARNPNFFRSLLGGNGIMGCFLYGELLVVLWGASAANKHAVCHRDEGAPTEFRFREIDKFGLSEGGGWGAPRGEGGGVIREK
ncbi:unnamed protein product [Closterium sp. Yama58-4]|nr:unnamed protein product [Closterium sp. Yama58-4]